MSKTLFVNACMRGELSRTLQLCREFLAKRNDVSEVDLTTGELMPHDGKTMAKRYDLQVAKRFDDSVFDLAHQFADAEEIVIGAPYWDLSFPAALKAYFEHTAVNEIVFHYTEQGVCEGLCKARRIVYITSSGGYLEGKNFGYEYVCGIAKMFGIPAVELVAAEGLDIVGIDKEAQMGKARDVMRKL